MLNCSVGQDNYRLKYMLLVYLFLLGKVVDYIEKHISLTGKNTGWLFNTDMWCWLG